MSSIIARVLETNIYIQPIHFLLAIITNIFNIRILCCRVLLSSPCTYYFLAYAILSIIYTCLLCPIQFVRGFSINWINGKMTCKMHAYLLFVLPLQGNIMLILASLDRYCSSLKLRQFQSRNVIQIARRNIICGTLFSLFYMLPMLFIYNWDENSRKCILKFHNIINIYILSQVIIYYILLPSMMILFGILTIYNIRRKSTRVVLFISWMRRRRRTECQLARMLILQVVVHLIFVLPFGIIYSINSFAPSTQTPTIIAIRLVFVSWQQCDHFLSFFLYILSASVYRQELIRLLKSIKCLNIREQ
ncbi:unnamed protein product [Rotaria sp. Silwood2]|nr:unnamed protein product [Rotaria sp. Silwood2]CAF2767196.1 unnamed protein product [Rotaria sp. Silwood2]CAF3196690.1 unnamed protein product [Rotaria sp. Silwood2]CAF4301716.1 unnamed protein product [Rotaria sp. Silwood2]CAF4355028.1 unnamed protein product [Rotaria sp. Silwood2]